VYQLRYVKQTGKKAIHSMKYWNVLLIALLVFVDKIFLVQTQQHKI